MRIVGIDHGSKESLVKECGAEVFLDITKFDDKTIAEEVKKVTGGKGAERQERSEITMLMPLQVLAHHPSSSALRQTKLTPRLSTF